VFGRRHVSLEINDYSAATYQTKQTWMHIDGIRTSK